MSRCRKTGNLRTHFQLPKEVLKLRKLELTTKWSQVFENLPNSKYFLMKIHEFIKTIKSQTAIFTTRNELDGAEFRFEAATTKIKIFRGIPLNWGEIFV